MKMMNFIHAISTVVGLGIDRLARPSHKNDKDKGSFGDKTKLCIFNSLL